MSQGDSRTAEAELRPDGMEPACCCLAVVLQFEMARVRHHQTCQSSRPRSVGLGLRCAVSLLTMSILGVGCREAPLQIEEPHLSPIASAPAAALPARYFPGESAGWSVHLRGISVGKVNLAANPGGASELNVDARFRPNRFARQFSNLRVSAQSRFDAAGWLLEATETMGPGGSHTRRVARDKQTIHSPLSLLGMLRSATVGQAIESAVLQVADTRYRVEMVAPTNDLLGERNVIRIDLAITQLSKKKRQRNRSPKRVQTFAATVWISRDHRSTLLRVDLEMKRSRVIAKSIFHDVPAVAMP